MFEKLRKTIFFLIVLFISFQVGLHFWPKFSYIFGARIDYLSPTIYFLDILIILYILLSAPSLVKGNIKPVKSNLLKILLAFFFLDLILNIFISKSPTAHIFGVAKFLEFGLFGFTVAQTFKKKEIGYFVKTLALSAVISSILAIWQFFSQSSIGGFWYFLGERTFNIMTVGISTVNLNQQVLRPYGAFPHPNVLAFFLMIATVFCFYQLGYEKRNREKIILVGTILLASFALLLTFSRIVILLTVCGFIYEVYTKANRNVRLCLLVLSIVLTFTLVQSLGSEFLLRGIDLRRELLEQSFIIFSDNPYFGIGLNNFFIHQIPLIKSISPIIFQPVHNIFVLALLSLGIFGFWALPAVLVLASRSVIQKMKAKDLYVKGFYKSVLFVLISIIIVGIFDHFFLTLEQGQIMLALILGFSFAKL